jgi:hypothetical protein
MAFCTPMPVTVLPLQEVPQAVGELFEAVAGLLTGTPLLA